MGRRPISEQGMQKTLSVRINEKVTAFLEHTRAALERDGEQASTSEVARQMLDAVVEQKLPAGFVVDKEEMLREILRAQRDELPLTQHHYAFLADQAHAAYQRTSRDFIRADLLLSNLNAFDAFLKLRNTFFPDRSEQPSDRYFYANLGSKAQDAPNLPTAIEQGRLLIRELGRPYRSTAEFMSRNLDVVLRDELNIPGDALDAALRPYLKELLLLALKAFSYENDRPVDSIENRHEMLDRLKLRAALDHRNDVFSLSFLDGNEDLSVYLTPVSNAWHLTCRYQRFVDLVQLVELERGASSEYFKLSRSPASGNYQFSAKDSIVDISLNLSESQMIELRNLIAVVLGDPEYRRVFSLLDLRYGAI